MPTHASKKRAYTCDLCLVDFLVGINRESISANSECSAWNEMLRHQVPMLFVR